MDPTPPTPPQEASGAWTKGTLVGRLKVWGHSSWFICLCSITCLPCLSGQLETLAQFNLMWACIKMLLFHQPVKTRIPRELGPWSFGGGGGGVSAVKWQRYVSWHTCPQSLVLSTLYFLCLPLMAVLQLPYHWDSDFASLSSQTKLRGFTSSWPTRKTQGQMVSLRWVCSPSGVILE